MIGNLFYGSEGWMAAGRRGFQVYKGEPGEKIMDEKAAQQERQRPHFQNFLDAVKSRNRTKLNADVAIGVPSANLVHLANISYRLGRELKFDDKTLTFPGDNEATALLTRSIGRRTSCRKRFSGGGRRLRLRARRRKRHGRLRRS